MKCEHVLGLIDAGPDADYPPAHLEAARQHARECPTCGPARHTADAIVRHLPALPPIAPPPHLAAAVAARIAAIDEPLRTDTSLLVDRRRQTLGDVLPWLAALGSATAAVAIAASLPSVEWNVRGIDALRAAWVGAGPALSVTPAGALAGTGGILVLTAWLFFTGTGAQRSG